MANIEISQLPVAIGVNSNADYLEISQATGLLGNPYQSKRITPAILCSGVFGVSTNFAVGTTIVLNSTNGYIFYNNNGVVGNFTVSGDGTLNTSSGTITITKTNGVAFGPLATASATLTTHGILLGEGTGISATAAMTAGQILVGQGATFDPSPETISGDAALASTGAITVTKTGGVAFGALATVMPGIGVTTAIGNNLNVSGGLAPILSPAFAGTPTATTNPNAGDASTQIATDAFVQAANLLAMSTVPMTIAAGTYSFASQASAPVILNVTASGGAVTSASVFNGGVGFAVGDLVTPNFGNFDALLRVATVSGTAALTMTVVYGGTGYTSQIGASSAVASTIPYTFLLSGVLSGNVTILATGGTYRTASQQWYFANNTTGNYTVTVSASVNNAPAGGRVAVIPQGTNNSRLVGVQTDGELNCDIASIVNAADLTGIAPVSVVAPATAMMAVIFGG